MSSQQRAHRDYLKHRRALKLAIAEARQDDGMMVVSESGMDCDGVQYWGHTRIIEATLEAFDALDDDTQRYADGPYSLWPVPVGATVERGSRDLAMEAYEDGHPHTIFTGGAS